ncbi:NAD(P)/FAD-dependent oxidoreductase [Pseudonocardia ailaonensis]|uniref:NAD(P)/FAD-dependent oxidoreductase n=1 Tax=Pseudonocardia ailaonensis TaxID=367279 RepID=A0ABN2NID0_9PSEU
MSGHQPATVPGDHLDVVIVGGGPSGLLQLHHLREAGLSVRLYEQGEGVGGSWYWCRYPGCRFDSESYTYAYTFSEELLKEWDFRELYSARADTERYFNHVADEFGLRADIRLGAEVTSAVYDDAAATWSLGFADGSRATCSILVTAVGHLSAAYAPDIAGIEDFRGTWLHTGRWPADGVDLAGKRVGVIGTGASGVQLVTSIASEVGHLSVFQRTATYCVPLRNKAITAEYMDELRSRYDEIFETCSTTPTAFPYAAAYGPAMEYSAQERHEVYERLWQEPGYKKWLAGFSDTMKPGPANEDYAEFVRGKIRERLGSPELVEKLVPYDHPFGAKRIPCEDGYYEVFNQSNVDLVDVRANPITHLVAEGAVTADGVLHELDVLVFATGYDAFTGALTTLDFRGSGGLTLQEKFRDGPRSYLGVMSAGFPNWFNVTAPGNFVRGLEPLVEWVTRCIAHVLQGGHRSIEAEQGAEDAWIERINSANELRLQARADSYFTGANIPGKARGVLTSPDSVPDGVAMRNEVAADGYRGFRLG